MNLGCLGSDNAERCYQRRLIALPIVPDYLKEQPAFAEAAAGKQLNILQTVVLILKPRIRKVMVKPHG
jgi:hypothetical protein